jgi:hypothetical protein
MRGGRSINPTKKLKSVNMIAEGAVMSEYIRCPGSTANISANGTDNFLRLGSSLTLPIKAQL